MDMIDWQPALYTKDELPQDRLTISSTLGKLIAPIKTIPDGTAHFIISTSQVYVRNEGEWVVFASSSPPALDQTEFLKTPGTTFVVDQERLFCEVLRYHPNTNSIEFYVHNGDWEGTLIFDTKQIYVHYTKQYHLFDTITDVKPPKRETTSCDDELWEDDVAF